MTLSSRLWERRSTRQFSSWSFLRWNYKFTIPLIILLMITFCSYANYWLLCAIPWAEKDCWSPSEYIYWIHWHNWYMGAIGRRPCHVRGIFSYICAFWRDFYLIASCFHGSLETTRHVSLITIKLSKKELDTSSPGYMQSQPFLFRVCSKFLRRLLSHFS